MQHLLTWTLFESYYLLTIINSINNQLTNYQFNIFIFKKLNKNDTKNRKIVLVLVPTIEILLLWQHRLKRCIFGWTKP